MSELAIEHDQERMKFFVLIDDQEALLQYRKIDHQTWDYYHTYVPPELRGRQIAGDIVHYALEYAKQHHLKIVPSCPFVADYIVNHSEYQNLIG